MPEADRSDPPSQAQPKSTRLKHSRMEGLAPRREQSGCVRGVAAAAPRAGRSATRSPVPSACAGRGPPWCRPTLGSESILAASRRMVQAAVWWTPPHSSDAYRESATRIWLIPYLAYTVRYESISFRHKCDETRSENENVDVFRTRRSSGERLIAAPAIDSPYCIGPVGLA